MITTSPRLVEWHRTVVVTTSPRLVKWHCTVVITTSSLLHINLNDHGPSNTELNKFSPPVRNTLKHVMKISTVFFLKQQNGRNETLESTFLAVKCVINVINLIFLQISTSDFTTMDFQEIPPHFCLF